MFLLQRAAVNLKVRWPFIGTLALLLMSDIVALATMGLERPLNPLFLISKTGQNTCCARAGCERRG